MEKYQADQRKWQGIPSIEISPGGRLWAAFYTGGADEGKDNFVLLKKSDDYGKTWSDPIAAVDPPDEVRAFDQCLWFDPDGRLWLFWAQSLGGFEPEFLGLFVRIMKIKRNNGLRQYVLVMG